MIKWLKARSTQEKWMLGLIVVLLAGIAVRWAWVKKEAADAFRERFSVPTEQIDTLRQQPEMK